VRTTRPDDLAAVESTGALIVCRQVDKKEIED